MADENHTQMLIQPQPPPTQQQQQMQQQQQLQQTQIQPQLQQPQMQQPQMQQQQMQQPQLQQQQLQQSPMQQQQQPQQTVAATMPMGNSVEQNNHMNVTAPLPINVATLNVSQPQMQTLQQTVNTSAGASVQMAVPQLTAQAQTVQAGNMMSQMSQSSAAYTTIHPTMTMSQSPLQQVQVMQQPISASYLQHLYPQQQFLLPGNLTLQHGMTGPTLQSIGAAQGLSLQLQATKTLDPKTSMGGQTLQAVNTNKAMAVNTGTMMTTSGQVIGTAAPKANFPQQMIATPGKQTIIHSQTGFTNQAPNQTVVIGQLGVIPNQQAIFNQKALADSQKGKTFTFHNQQATLQPKSLYSSTVPVHSTAQVFNGSHMKPIGTQSQILTSQSPATMLGNAQLFGLSAAFPQGLSWSPAGNLQLANNQPIIFQRQQSTDMFIQSPSQSAMQIPVAAATAPIPPTTYAPAPLAPSKPKQVRFATQTVAVATQTIVTTAATMNSNANPLRAQVRPKGRYSAASSPIAPSANAAPRMATTQTQTNQSHSQPPAQLPPNAQQQQKSDAGNQTHPGQPKPVTTPESKSASTQSKSVGVETKQHLSPQPPLKSQAMIAPSTKAQNTVSPTISTSLSPATSCDVTTTTTSTVSSTTTPTNTVLPSMPIITTYATVAPTPTSPVATVAVTDNSTVTPKMSANGVSQELEESVDDPPVSQPPSEVATECEPLKPQPMLKPNLSPVKEKQPQKAIVKPQILTHVIDGFVIQEGPEPFPVSRSALLDSSYRVMPPEKLKKIEDSPTAASPEKKRNTVHRPRGNVELAKCEFCGKMGPKYKFKRSKRFCSTSCAKRYNVCYSKGLLPATNQENVAAGRKKKQGFKGRRGRKQSLTDQDLESSPVQMEVVPEPINEEPLITSIKVEEEVCEMPMDVGHQNVTQVEKVPEEVEIVEVPSNAMRKLPTKWTVQDVFEFIRDVPGCSEYADTFRSQEIDGQALLLLKEDHLMTVMSMRLGPALKLISQIRSIKEELGQS